MTSADEVRREKARNLRFKKPLSRDFNIYQIQQTLGEIVEACDEVSCFFSEDEDETLLDALDGDEDAEDEFKMMFADLSAECEQMQGDLDEWTPWDEGYADNFDLLFTAADKPENLIGWDSYEQDYFGLDSDLEEERASKAAKEKLMRLKKADIIDLAQWCFKVAQSYFGILYRYDCLKGAMDILKGENREYLDAVKAINEVYEKADRDSCGFQYSFKDSVKELDRLAGMMPAIAWVQ